MAEVCRCKLQVDSCGYLDIDMFGQDFFGVHFADPYRPYPSKQQNTDSLTTHYPMAPQQPAAAASSILGRLTNHCGVRVTLVDQRSLSIHPKAPETAEISTSNAEWI